MDKTQMIYVIDTNILVDYVDIIPNGHGEGFKPEEPTIDLTGAHLVIPTAVIRELSSFKKEKSERGKAARTVLRRIRAIIDGKTGKIHDFYHMEDGVAMKVGDKIISILPVHKNFKKALPFCPSEDDMDAQIILACLTVAFLNAGLPIDGTAEAEQVMKLNPKGVMLLTNDNGLAIRARERGVLSERYGYKMPEPYTGRRDIVVPKEIFQKFYNDGAVSREEFEAAMPGERRLVANEFVVMRLESRQDYPRGYDPDFDPYFLRIGRYDLEEDAIVPLRYVEKFPIRVKNPGQAIYAEALMNPKYAAVICTGPAGSGKTYMATVYGLMACRNGQYIGVTVVPCESRSKLGALPGDIDEKMDPDVQPLKNALRNYLLNEDSKLRKEIGTIVEKNYDDSPDAVQMQSKNGDNSDRPSMKSKLKKQVDKIWEDWFSSTPIEVARGRDFAYEIALYDEFQDQNAMQADTLVKRIGTKGKIVLTGDIEQIHAPYLDRDNNGLVYASHLLIDNPMVAQVHFTEDEVVRHPLVKMVAKRQKAENSQKTNSSST